MAALAPAGSSTSPTWTVRVPDTDVDSLKQQLSEQEVVIAFQGNMLSAVAGQAPAVDREIVKTLDVFQRNQEKQQHVIDSLVEEIKRVNALLVQSESRLQEEKKTHEVYEKKSEQLINELRAQNAALNDKFLKLESTVTTVKSDLTKLEKRYTNHSHLQSFIPCPHTHTRLIPTHGPNM